MRGVFVTGTDTSVGKTRVAAALVRALNARGIRTLGMKPIASVRDDYDTLAAQAECVVVEGVGGWAVPLSDNAMQADLVRALELPVLLVVGVRLGCINHALLTARALAADGITLFGWVANRIDPSLPAADAALATIAQALGGPPLADLSFEPDGTPCNEALAALCERLSPARS